jgi:hypothetical protein
VLGGIELFELLDLKLHRVFILPHFGAQQMMELLLARMNANIKEHMKEMTARMETSQAKLEAARNAD